MQLLFTWLNLLANYLVAIFLATCFIQTLFHNEMRGKFEMMKKLYSPEPKICEFPRARRRFWRVPQQGVRRRWLPRAGRRWGAKIWGRWTLAAPPPANHKRAVSHYWAKEQPGGISETQQRLLCHAQKPTQKKCFYFHPLESYDGHRGIASGGYVFVAFQSTARGRRRSKDCCSLLQNAKLDLSSVLRGPQTASAQAESEAGFYLVHHVVLVGAAKKSCCRWGWGRLSVVCAGAEQKQKHWR